MLRFQGFQNDDEIDFSLCNCLYMRFMKARESGRGRV